MNEIVKTAVGTVLNVRVYRKGETFTVLYMDRPVPGTKMFDATIVNACSIGQCQAAPGALIGKRAAFIDLPQQVRDAIQLRDSRPVELRKVHAQRARKLRRKGVMVFWSTTLKSLVWERPLAA